MRCWCDRDDSVPALALAHIVDNVEGSWRLDDPDIDAGEAATKLGQSAAHTPFAQASVLWTVGAIHTVGQIVRGRLLASGRRRSIRPIFATRQLVPANQGVSHQGPIVFALRCLPLFRFRRQRRNLPIGGINDHPRAPAGRPLRSENRVIGAGDIRLAAQRRANLIAEDGSLRSFAIQFGNFLLCVKLTGDPRRSFQRHHQFHAPNALEIRLAPGRLERNRVRLCCRCLAFYWDGCQPQKNEHTYDHCQCTDDLERSFVHFTSPFSSLGLKKPGGGPLRCGNLVRVQCPVKNMRIPCRIPLSHSFHSNTFSDATTADSLYDRSMIYRELGKTGEKVSAIGVGGWHLGLKSVDEALAIRIVRTAIDAGINFLDNCWDYQEGASEIRMGKALRDGYRAKAFLMTKIDGRSKESANRQLDESLKRFGVDHIDLVQHHEILRYEDPHRIFDPDGANAALVRARAAGKIRYIGFTGHKDPHIHLYMLEVADQNGFMFDTVQMPLNLFDAHYRSFGKLVQIGRASCRER